MILQQSVHVAKLLVSNHFVLEHELLLTHMLQSSEDIPRLIKILKVHAHHTVCLQCPVVAIELVLLLLFYQVAESIHDCKDS